MIKALIIANGIGLVLNTVLIFTGIAPLVNFCGATAALFGLVATYKLHTMGMDR